MSILILVGLIAAIIGASTLLLQARVSASAVRDRQLEGRYAAQAGLSRALMELHDDGTWSPTLYTDQLTDRIKFEVEVLNNRDGLGTVTAPDGTAVAPRYVWLRSTAVVDGERIRGRIGQATAQAVQPLPIFDFAIHSTGQPPGAWRKNTVDSYDGDLSTYIPFGTPGRPNRVKANLRFDAGGTGDLISIDGNVFVPDPAVEVNLTNSVLTGAFQIDETQYLPLHFIAPKALREASVGVCPSSGYIPPGRYNSLPHGTSDLSLGEGEYYFESFDAYTRPNVTLLGPGPTTMYIDRGFYPGANFNSGGLAENLRVFFVDGIATNSFQQETGSTFVGVVAGAKLRFNMTTNNRFFGAVICDVVPYTQDNSVVTYDETLQGRVLEAETQWVLVNQGDD